MNLIGTQRMSTEQYKLVITVPQQYFLKKLQRIILTICNTVTVALKFIYLSRY